ncbi:hypothetical protein [Anaplasma phagocytophilum]|uniref:hypothetical protein n=1 Tax=Anaplasma phagocytophilum TaxID=948 RepID=UPI00201AA9BB
MRLDRCFLDQGDSVVGLLKPSKEDAVPFNQGGTASSIRDDANRLESQYNGIFV